MSEQWRVGRTLGRTLYVDDQVVGMVDTPELAQRIVDAMNRDSGSDSADQAIVVRYTNYRGVAEDRHIVPKTVWFGKSQWHESEQWFMEAIALDRDGATRDFALRDMQFRGESDSEASYAWLRVYKVCDEPRPAVHVDQWATACIDCSIHGKKATGHASGMDVLEALDQAAESFVTMHRGLSPCGNRVSTEVEEPQGERADPLRIVAVHTTGHYVTFANGETVNATEKGALARYVLRFKPAPTEPTPDSPQHNDNGEEPKSLRDVLAQAFEDQYGEASVRTDRDAGIALATFRQYLQRPELQDRLTGLIRATGGISRWAVGAVVQAIVDDVAEKP